MTLRLPEDEEAYTRARLTNDLRPIVDEPAIATYVYWNIVPNRFPHSRLALRNDMLVLRRKASLDELTAEEWLELKEILLEVREIYDIVLYNFPSMSSVKDTPHLHLEVLRPEYTSKHQGVDKEEATIYTL